VTAADVAFSIERIIDQKVRADHFAAVDRIDTVDAGTVVLHLREPFAPMRTYLAHPMNAIVDRAAVTSFGGDLRDKEAGAGPYRLTSWRRGQELVLDRHEGYYAADRPVVDRLIFRPMPDPTARSTALQTGEVDVLLDVPAKDLALLRGAAGVRVASVPGTFWEYVGMNVRRRPFEDRRVRQAVAWAIDRGMVNRLIKFGQATVLDGGHLPPNHWAFADLEMYPTRDVARARALLAEAGYPDGFETTLKVGSAFPYQVQAAVVVKQHLAEAGIRVKLLCLESAVFFDGLARHDFDMTLVGWVGFVDPDEWTWNLFHSDGKWNQQGYGNDALDALLAEGRREQDREARREIYREAQRIIAEDAPVAFLYVNDQTSAYREAVRGFEVHATAATLSLREARLAR
jgi:peptide/nickel transport system substrate-binding protein